MFSARSKAGGTRLEARDGFERITITGISPCRRRRGVFTLDWNVAGVSSAGRREEGRCGTG